MTMTDPVADYLTRLRNAIQAKHKRVDVPASNLKRELTKLLLEQQVSSAGYTEIKEVAAGCPADSAEVQRRGSRSSTG